MGFSRIKNGLKIGKYPSCENISNFVPNKGTNIKPAKI